MQCAIDCNGLNCDRNRVGSTNPPEEENVKGVVRTSPYWRRAKMTLPNDTIFSVVRNKILEELHNHLM